MTAPSSVLVITDEAQSHQAIAQILSVARSLCASTHARSTLVAPSSGGKYVEQAGVDEVMTYEPPQGESYGPEAMTEIVRAAVREVGPRVILVPHSATTRDFAAHVAYAEGGSILTGCTAVRIEEDVVVVSRPIEGGMAVAEYEMLAPPCVVTLRGHSDKSSALPPAGPATLAVSLAPTAVSRVRVLHREREVSSLGPTLENARLVVGGGRGLCDPKNWRLIEELAATLGAAVGATRAATDAGWVPPALQVGLTGKTIAPDVYFAVGISGATQHLAGITAAKNVIAINKDADAEIFKRATLGVVGDCLEVLPALTARLRELKSSAERLPVDV